jgi:hypothetical protein
MRRRSASRGRGFAAEGTGAASPRREQARLRRGGNRCGFAAEGTGAASPLFRIVVPFARTDSPQLSHLSPQSSLSRRSRDLIPHTVLGAQRPCPRNPHSRGAAATSSLTLFSARSAPVPSILTLAAQPRPHPSHCSRRAAPLSPQSSLSRRSRDLIPHTVLGAQRPCPLNPHSRGAAATSSLTLFSARSAPVPSILTLAAQPRPQFRARPGRCRCGGICLRR